MESIPKDPILQFHPDTMVVTRQLYNLDKPGQIDAAVDLLEDWLKKQAHFKKNIFSREYLERTIVMDKGSVERAKNQLDKLFTLKTLVPRYFEKFVAGGDLKNNFYIQAFLPKLTNDHYRVYAGKIVSNGITTQAIFNTYELFTLLLEYVRAHDYVCGVFGILDYRDVNISEIVSQMNINEFRQIITILTDGYQMRIKGIHILTTSKTIEVLVKILKQLLNKKVGDRIVVHSSVETLYEHIPKEILPTEFGGDEKSLNALSSEWIDVIKSEENTKYLKDMYEARTDEALRTTAKFSEQYIGMAGTFRTLSVD